MSGKHNHETNMCKKNSHFSRSARPECISIDATACVSMAPKRQRPLDLACKSVKAINHCRLQAAPCSKSHNSHPEAFPKAAKRFLPLTGGAGEAVPAGVSDADEAGDGIGGDLHANKLQS